MIFKKIIKQFYKYNKYFSLSQEKILGGGKYNLCADMDNDERYGI